VLPFGEKLEFRLFRIGAESDCFQFVVFQVVKINCGHEVARQLAQQGMTVFMGSRDSEKVILGQINQPA
jgi:hypothetical protein